MLKLMMQPRMSGGSWYPTGVQGSKQTLPEQVADYLWSLKQINDDLVVDENVYARRIMSGETVTVRNVSLRLESE